jgi:hypothetical protein
VSTDLLAVQGTSARDVWIGGAGGAILHRSDALPSAFGGACTGAIRIGCGSRIDSSIVDQAELVDFSQCSGAGGGQVFYQLASPVTGHVRARLETRSDDVTLAITEGDSDGRCQRDGACRGHLRGAGDAVVAAVQGEILFLTVSGAAGASRSFSLAVDCQRGVRPFDD